MVIPTDTATRTISLLTAGDQVGTMRMVGAVAGTAALDNLDGTFSVFLAHDLADTQGTVRRHGAGGSFVSEWVYRKATLEPLMGRDVMTQVMTRVDSVWQAQPAQAFSHFGGLDLADPGAYAHASSGTGTSARLLLVGEINANGRAMAQVVTGTDKGSSYVLPWADRSTDPAQQVSWQQLRANPAASPRTVVIGHLGGNQSGLLLYVGTKRASGNDVERAGLIGGLVYRVEVPDALMETRAGDAGLGVVERRSSFRLVGGTGVPAQDRVAGGTHWLNPHDGAWDPLNPRRYYFVTTDRMDASKDGNLNPDTRSNQVGRSRLWRLTFNDLMRPEDGGTLELLQNGRSITGAAYQMLSSVLVRRNGSLSLAEDPGLNARPAQIWQARYRADLDVFQRMSVAASADAALFGDLGSSGPLSRAEGWSNLVDADAVLGMLSNGHYCLISALRDRTPAADPAIIEGGQQLLMCLR